MLPTRSRFRGDKLFSLVYKKGWKNRSNSFVAYFYQAEQWRVAVVVSKKTAAKANVRNLIRRRFFAAMRLSIKDEVCKPGYLILVVNKSAVGLNYASINTEIVDCLRKINTSLSRGGKYDKKNSNTFNKLVPKNNLT